MYSNLQIAEICHEANRAICESLPDPATTTPPIWDLCPRWQQASILAGVRFVLENPEGSPQETHESWSADKISHGWKYGAVKDGDAKTHPCLVPYGDLPAHQKAKDFVFRAIVLACSKINNQERAEIADGI